MRYLMLAIGLVLCCCSSSHAQDVPRVEIFGGYSYLDADVSAVNKILNQLEFPSVGNRLSLNGWDASANINFNQWAGIEADFSGHYKGDCEAVSGLTCNNPSNLIPGASDVSASLSNTSFALAAGGGVDYAVTNRISVRLGQADYFLTRHFSDIGVPNQNNFRVSAGIVFTLGGTRESSARTPDHPEHAPRAATGCEASGEAALLGVVGCSSDNGVKVTSVLPGSPASQAGISSGDTITDIDGRPVRSSRDIEAAIAANTSGTIKIRYMIRGAWLTEREAKIR